MASKEGGDKTKVPVSFHLYHTFKRLVLISCCFNSFHHRFRPAKARGTIKKSEEKSPF